MADIDYKKKIAELIKKAIMDYNQDPNPECAFDYYVPSIADQILHIPISEGKVCDKCRGYGTIHLAGGDVNSGAGVGYTCPDCKGIKLPPVTIEDVIKEKLNGCL